MLVNALKEAARGLHELADAAERLHARPKVTVQINVAQRTATDGLRRQQFSEFLAELDKRYGRK